MSVIRLLKVLCLLVVACLVLPPAPTVGAPLPAPVFGITIIDDLRPPVAGQPLSFDTAFLTEAGDPIAGRTLTLEIQPYGAAAFAPAATTTTNASGQAAVTVSLERTTSYRWHFAGDADFAEAYSPTLVRLIGPRVTARANDRSLRRGQRLVVRGRTFPAKAGCTVRLLRGQVRPLATGPRPARLARTTVRSDGSYKLVRRFHKVAQMRVVVKVSACAGNDWGVSRHLRLRVR
jgi:hypothetical protein